MRHAKGKIFGGVILALIMLSSPVSLTLYADELEDAMQAVVYVRATVPAEASTANVLGTERAGNGVLIDPSGLVLTIGYLVLEASNIEVQTGFGTFPAEFVGYDRDTGFGLVRAEILRGQKPIPLGESSLVEVGDELYIGDFGRKAQPATVIFRGEFVGYWEYLLENAVYAAPAIEQFGGAALISDGKLVGIGSILTTFFVDGLGRLPVNMYVPIDLLKPILEEMIRTGSSGLPARPWLGVISAEVEERVVITRVTSDSPAEQAGLLPGDVILAVEDEPITKVSELYRKVWSAGPAGVKIRLRVIRNQRVRDITVQSIDANERFRQSPRTPGLITLVP